MPCARLHSQLHPFVPLYRAAPVFSSLADTGVVAEFEVTMQTASADNHALGDCPFRAVRTVPMSQVLMMHHM